MGELSIRISFFFGLDIYTGYFVGNARMTSMWLHYNGYDRCWRLPGINCLPWLFFKAMCYPVLRRIIIMIDTHVYRFDKSIIFYVVATQEIINDLCAYADMHHKSDSFHIVDFMKRILFHDAYCCVTSNSFFYGMFAYFFRREFKKKQTPDQLWSVSGGLLYRLSGGSL